MKLSGFFLRRPLRDEVWWGPYRLCRSALVVESAAGRLRGLMFRRRFPGDGMLLRPCGGIHTCFVRWPIDALFLDREGRVLRECGNIAPFSLRTAPRGCRQVLELPAGILGARPRGLHGYAVRLRHDCDSLAR